MLEVGGGRVTRKWVIFLELKAHTSTPCRFEYTPVLTTHVFGAMQLCTLVSEVSCPAAFQ